MHHRGLLCVSCAGWSVTEGVCPPFNKGHLHGHERFPGLCPLTAVHLQRVNTTSDVPVPQQADLTVGRSASTRPRKFDDFCKVLSSATRPTNSPTATFGWLGSGLLGPGMASPPNDSSSAFRLANSRAAAFLSFAVPRPHVACTCPRECRRAAAKPSFIASSQSLGMEGKAETVH